MPTGWLRLRGLLPNAIPGSTLVNASGYVRVDEAEQHFEDCDRVNARGPAILAAACQNLGIQLLTYSSDLVFDGS